MGGVKRKSLKQIEKQQKLREKKKSEQRRRAESRERERKKSDIAFQNLSEKEIIGDLSKMRAITSYAVASKYDMKLSTAKNMLNTLEKKGLIQLVAANSNLKLYRFKGASSA